MRMSKDINKGGIFIWEDIIICSSLVVYLVVQGPACGYILYCGGQGDKEKGVDFLRILVSLFSSSLLKFLSKKKK